MSERVQQVNELLKQDVAGYLQVHLGDHAGLLTITAVETAHDLKTAVIWYGYVGDDLGKVSGQIRRLRRDLQAYINKKFVMKSVPKITLKYDKSGDYAVEISKLIDDANRNQTINK
jgi:ribosome-binding factor A